MPQAPPQIISELVERFERNLDSYKGSGYNETQVRREFIDPFFKALGWDIANEGGLAEAYKDVIHEDAIKVGAPDYCFRIGGARKFFLEAKKPAVNIKDDPDPAYQLRRYAWSAKLPLSILTDFEEFAVYECLTKPRSNDKVSVGRTLYLTYKDYLTRWTEIASIFSKDAVLKGSFDKYAVSDRKRGTATVDAEFLAEIERWRDTLARNLAIRNTLNVYDLNFAVQQTIDRIIFLRICEDRGIESDAQLMALLNGEHVYDRLLGLFHRADDRYNSGLFHFRPEKDRAEAPDELTPGLKIDDKVLKDIIRSLYYPESPYEFSVFPAEILGQVYEQFLGKVIRLISGHQAKVEEKPEVKKAGGVYYTPAYIVDYIVKNTVGKLCEGKTPKQISKLKILDPACGSGSFLIGAYDYLLNHHCNWYVKDGTEKHTKEIYQIAGGGWRLTTQEKKRILLNNIYGVDIDSQAVEVTKLSLLLKLLEGESQDTLIRQTSMYRALPDLGNNIKCGNSLIGHDYFSGQLIPDEEERHRINPFDWQKEFSEIMKTAGFDAVIGNPPYIGFHGFMSEKEYLKNLFVSAKGKFDYYLPFIENGVRVLKENGILGFICPTNFTKREHGKALRKHLCESVKILEICDFQDHQIFSGALNYTGIFIFEKALPDKTHLIQYKYRTLEAASLNVHQSSLTGDVWIFRDDAASRVVEKVKRQPVALLGEITRGISEGIVTGQNDVFLMPYIKAESLGLEDSIIRPCIRGRQIRRYLLDDVEEVVIYPYGLVNKKTKVLPGIELRRNKQTWSYLNARRNDLAGRPYFEASSKAWYELWCQRDFQLMAAPKIVVPELSESNRFALANEDQFYGDTVCGIILLPMINENLRYVLGLLNSRLMEFYYKRTTVPKASGFYIYKTMFLKNVPIRRINFSDKSDKSKHDKMVSLVDQMLDLNKRLAVAKTPNDKTKLQRQIGATDQEIDRLVYDLYGLTEEEIAIVEKN